MNSNTSYQWNILGKLENEKAVLSDIIDILLENRGLKTKKEKDDFLYPELPEKITVKELGISEKSLKKVIERIEEVIKNKEKIIVYGDYDADGICATAILWETLFAIGADVAPYIPDRFSEGYGLNGESIQSLRVQNEKLKLIITVDNGIVANSAVDVANDLNIDVIITDHHEAAKILPNAYGIIHTTKVGGAGVSWFLAREIRKVLGTKNLKSENASGLELAAIGTIADQIPLVGPNRSIAKFGLNKINNTTRPGLLSLLEDAGIKKGEVEAYHVGFVIAPRINAMGRMEHAIDSLRLLCTKDAKRGKTLSNLLNKTNSERQRTVEEVLLHAREAVQLKKWSGAIILADETYHEGIIGLAASRLVEEFYRPAIVISKGEKISKASARSITGFNIIENIRKMDGFLLGGGGHPMAAGFSIETEKIALFTEEFEKITAPFLTEELLIKKLRIDLALPFRLINKKLAGSLKGFEPSGLGNPTPIFLTEGVNVVDFRTVGMERKHLKLKMEKDGAIFDAIGFGMGGKYKELSENKKVDIVYQVDENVWNGNTALQLKLRDIKVSV